MRRTVLTLLALLLGAVSLLAAPIPAEKPKKIKAPTRLEEVQFAGEYDLSWGDDYYAMTLGKDGAYKAVGDHATYVGSWRVRDGIFCINEIDMARLSEQPIAPDGWTQYDLGIDYQTLEGTIVGQCANGLRVKIMKVETRKDGAERIKSRPKVEEDF